VRIRANWHIAGRRVQKGAMAGRRIPAGKPQLGQEAVESANFPQRKKPRFEKRG